jgi:hexosaminidase
MYRRLPAISRQLEELGITHERNYPVLLRRLANGGDIEALRTLVSVIEPVKEYRRYRLRPQTMLSPLTGLVDAARPDSEAGRKFASMVEGMLADGPRFQLYRSDIREALASWRDAGAELDPVIDRAPALHEARPLAKDLASVAAAGLEALAYLSAGNQATAQWRDAQLAKLEEAAKPKAALEFVMIPSIKKLVIAAAEPPR